VEKHRGERPQAYRRMGAPEPARIFRIDGVAAEARPRLRLVQSGADAEPTQPEQPVVRVRCVLCGIRERTETRRTPLSTGAAGVITCHQLDCGHTWHRTVANVGGIFPGLVRNATFVPCDCGDGAHQGQ